MVTPSANKPSGEVFVLRKPSALGPRGTNIKRAKLTKKNFQSKSISSAIEHVLFFRSRTRHDVSSIWGSRDPGIKVSKDFVDAGIQGSSDPGIHGTSDLGIQ